MLSSATLQHTQQLQQLQTQCTSEKQGLHFLLHLVCTQALHLLFWHHVPWPALLLLLC
jgi:hypothetical protein